MWYVIKWLILFVKIIHFLIIIYIEILSVSTAKDIFNYILWCGFIVYFDYVVTIRIVSYSNIYTVKEYDLKNYFEYLYIKKKLNLVKFFTPKMDF